MILARLARPLNGLNVEDLFGADRTRIVRWTDTYLYLFFDAFNHQLRFVFGGSNK